MVDFAFHRDAYLTELDTEVVEVGEDAGRPIAVLADTVFYPEGGGQPADHGKLGAVQVIDVQKDGDRIRHFLSHPVAAGPVHIELDWRRRWDHMQQHTAQHVLTATVLARFGWRTTAFHLGPEVSDIELDVPRLERTDLDRFEEAVADEVAAARSISYRSAEAADFERLGVRSRRLPDGFTGPVRLVAIEGLDLNTCGGTHLRSTAEIGSVCVIGSEPMRGGTRIFFVAGERVRRRMARHEARNHQLRTLLDSGDDDLPEVIALRLDREKQLARAVRQLTEELADHAAASLARQPGALVDAHWEDRDMGFLQHVGRRLTEADSGKRALLTASDEGSSLFVVVAGTSSGLDLANAGPQVAKILGGRGGGRGELYQGKARSLADRAHALALLRPPGP